MDHQNHCMSIKQAKLLVYAPKNNLMEKKKKNQKKINKINQKRRDTQCSDALPVPI